MSTTLFFRKAFSGQFSIEQVFETLLPHFPPAVRKHRLSQASKSLLPRLKSGLEARRHQGAINHITGDITYVAPFLDGNRTILTFHDFDFIKRTSGLKSWLLFFFWVYWPVRHVQYITTISEATKADLLALMQVAPEKIRVIPNPLTLVEEPIPPAAKNNKTPVLLHIGTKANKNLERLIPALAGLDIHLEIVGKLKQEQTALLQQHQITYHNSWNISKAALIQKYQQADLLTFVSIIEGFGLPIVEAQALGCPVLTSSISSMPEVAGAGAYLVDPYDNTAIRNAVQALLSDPGLRAKLIEKGYQNVQRFQPQQIARQYMELYEEVARA
jgi:glycosyltransferase involved in cell wall biosynthesis